MLKQLSFFTILLLLFVNFGLSQTIEKSNNNYEEIKKTLEKVWETDQGIRQKLTPFIQKGETNTPEYKELALSMKKIDEENLKIVTAILDKYGWLGNEEVGFQNSQAIFLVIQHSDLPTQEKYLPVIRKAAADGKTLQSNMALLEDRVLMRRGKRQIYGSQVWIYGKTGTKYLYPLDDADNVDKRRLKVGLNPIAEYLEKSFGIKWNAEEYKKNLSELEEIIKKDKEERAKKATGIKLDSSKN